jgi:hypothetical protein
VHVPTFSDDVFEGVVDRMGGALDPVNRTLPLYVRLARTGGKLLPRMPAELSVVIGKSDAALAIPRSALLGDFGDQFVFVEKDAERGLFQRVGVARGLEDDQFVEILEGLLPGDRVVSVGNYPMQFLPPFEEQPIDNEPRSESGERTSPHETRRSVWRLVATGLALLVGASVAAFTVRRLRRLRNGV